MQDKILVTGSAGFIGFHLTRALLKNGYLVTGMDNLNDYYNPQLKMDRLEELDRFVKEKSLSSNYQFIKMDMKEAADMEMLFQEDQFDYGYEEEEQFGYEEEQMFEEFVFEFDEQHFEEQEFMFEEEIIFEEMFRQDEFVDPFPLIPDFEMPREEIFIPVEDLIIEEFIFQETFLVEDFREPETFIELETIEELEEWFEEETRREEEVAILEDPEEEFIEEIFEEEIP